MRLNECGARLIELASKARGRFILAAPYIKVGALGRILDVLDSEVSLTCISRWRVDELRCGVSDADVWLILNQRPKSVLLLQQKLHAKYYRADDTCLVGSANVTEVALGWAVAPNLELLIDMPFSAAAQDFEAEVLRGSFIVTKDLYSSVADLHKMGTEGLPSPEHLIPLPSPQPHWVPHTRDPSDVWTQYAGQGDKLIRAARESAARDLAILAPPPGLDRTAFNAHVAIALRANQAVVDLDAFIEVQPRRFGEVRTFLAERYGDIVSDSTIPSVPT